MRYWERRRRRCCEAGRKPCGKPADRRMGVPRRRRLQVASCLGRWRGMNSSNESRGGEVVVYEAPDGQVRFDLVCLSIKDLSETAALKIREHKDGNQSAPARRVA